MLGDDPGCKCKTVRVEIQMKIIVALDVGKELEVVPDAAIKDEIANLVKDYHAYSMIKSYTVEVIR
jgi:hypothetical protein